VKVLFLIPRLDCSGTAKQALLLAAGLPRPPFEVRVCVVGGPGPFTASFKQAGLEPEHLNARGFTDARPLLRLRELLHTFRPDVIHVCQLTALRWYALAALGQPAPVVLSNPLQSGQLPWFFDRWLLRHARRVVVQGDGEAARCRQRGFPTDNLVTIPPAVAPPAALHAPLGLPAQARYLACLGQLERRKGFRDAVWALGILRFLFDDLRLFAIGSGPERDRLQAFARGIDCAGQLHFLGQRADGPDLLPAAEIVWVPELGDGGANATLAGMAAGRPVIATRRSQLAELVVDGETGFLIEPGDKTALSRKTRLLLETPDLRQQMGEAGRRRAAELFSVAERVRRFTQLYQDVLK